LSPFRPEAGLPVDIRLDDIAAAHLDGGLASEALCGAVQRGDPPIRHLLQVDVERRSVELDNIDVNLDQIAGPPLSTMGKGHGEGCLLGVMCIGDRVDDGHWSGQCEFEPASGHGRHFCLLTIVAGAQGHSPGEIHTLNLFEKPVDEVLPRLLAICHDVNPAIFPALSAPAKSLPLASKGCVPSNGQDTHNVRGLANEPGFGKLAVIVVSSMSGFPRSTLAIGGS
jgi:hypothetical protein